MLQRVINSFSSSFATKHDQRNCLHSVETIRCQPQWSGFHWLRVIVVLILRSILWYKSHLSLCI